MKKHELELDYLAPFLAQIGDPPHISRQEAYKLKEECLQDLKHRLIDKANLIQARFEKVCIMGCMYRTWWGITMVIGHPIRTNLQIGGNTPQWA